MCFINTYVKWGVKIFDKAMAWDLGACLDRLRFGEVFFANLVPVGATKVPIESDL